jgi:hypothetical protein
MIKKFIMAAPLAAMLAAPSAQAADDTIRVGINLVLTTPASIIGKQMKAAFELTTIFPALRPTGAEAPRI